MDAGTIIPLVLSEEEQSLYNKEFGTTEMDAYKFLSENMYCSYFDWKEGTENLSHIINFVQRRTLHLRGEMLPISPSHLIKKFSMSSLFRNNGGWMQYILSELSLLLQNHQLNLVNWDMLDDGYRIVITTESKALSLRKLSLEEGRFQILKSFL